MKALLLGLGLAASLPACQGESCDREVSMRQLQSGTYQTPKGAKFTFPGLGIQQKTMVYDEPTHKLTITYTYSNKRYVETWTVASTSKVEHLGS